MKPEMSVLYSFPSDETCGLAEVGGKGLSLVRLLKAGLPVPSGLILTTSFFDPWFKQLKDTNDWKDLATAPTERWPDLCRRLKALGESLSLDEAQKTALSSARERLAEHRDDALFAVRSSSPDEDLATASFAGGYETKLGVTLDALEPAIRACFASSLDLRVLTYKRRHGFDASSPRIAVIVQAQIDSETAGVGFSINPLSNDFDEAVIDANWGLGETVVAGLATPDHFVVEKVERKVISRELGKKQVAHWLKRRGGTRQSGGARTEEFALSAPQLRELVELLCRVENLFGFPVDIEWGYADGKLHLLQARPITTFVPLPPEMLTRPGERRRLYADISLSSGLTINAPISTMGLEWMQETLHAMFKPFIGTFQLTLEPRNCLWFFAGNRMYQDLSNVLWIASPKTLAKAGEESDALMSETLMHLDRERYRTKRRPRWFGWRLFKILPRFVWSARGLAWNTGRALFSPKRAAARHYRSVAAYCERIKTELDFTLPLAQFREQVSQLVAERVFADVMPAMAAYIFAHSSVERVAGKRDPERKELAQKLKLGFKGNVVVEMGIALSDLAQCLESQRFDDLQQLRADLDARRLPSAFLARWEDFLARFGCRGPREMDLGHPRFADDPCIALAQMACMAGTGQRFDPRAAQEKLIQERLGAYERLMEGSGRLRRALLRRIHTLLDLFGGTRDTPKHQILLAYQTVRTRILREGVALQRVGRLDTPEQVFDLSFADLEKASADPSFNLRQAREKRLVFKRQLERQVPSFPGLIDSRGRILRPPPRPETPGEIHGTPISNGIVRGPIKTLRSPDEKPIEPGDVLVAYTTDPGWTPLFINASAIILEVGGVLQHGAVVAREYGKPCVAGIDRVLTRLQDGQQVEVDGTRGIIRVLHSEAISANPASLTTS